MHPSVQLGNEVRAALRIRFTTATAVLYEMIGLDKPVDMPRFVVRHAGREFFHIVDVQTGKVRGYHRDHNKACALARRLEQQE